MIVMTGVAEFNHALEELVARASAASRAAVTTGGHLLEAEAKRLLGLTSHTRGTQTPSEPGQPPSLITGTLRRSIKVTAPESTSRTGWTISVGPSVIYGRIQELGGNTGPGGATYLPPRPYMEPALKNVISNGSLAACYATAWRTAF